MPLSNQPKTSVSVNEAKRRMRAFKSKMKQYLDPIDDHKIPKSIWVPYTDFEQAINIAKLTKGVDIELSGMRIYLTIEEKPGSEDFNITGLVVPTIKVMQQNGTSEIHEDVIVHLNTPKEGGSLNSDDMDSSIYDMTYPCPSVCDGSGLDV
ncbi:MAG: hypothetical protein J0I09_07625 [Sphingobacteriia bacterium]|nr:hypothetical protein [Sphingobacteriia bacterium]